MNTPTPLHKNPTAKRKLFAWFQNHCDENPDQETALAPDAKKVEMFEIMRELAAESPNMPVGEALHRANCAIFGRMVSKKLRRDNPYTTVAASDNQWERKESGWKRVLKRIFYTS